MPATHNSILALDVGDKRVGVAVASVVARLPRPLVTVMRGKDCLKELSDIIDKEDAGEIVVGLPRGLDGQPTAQTEATESFVAELKKSIDLPVHLQDEAVTSRQAEAELNARGQSYEKGDIDALAATYILEDFLNGYNGTK
ncbi:MAG TPA: Holliday junction resolvase RuvX [Candidatus Saccharimonadales bacterium]|nr:Holliday junction resolvase RuvX [Candidatus Saccharimonadales bacterium]